MRPLYRAKQLKCRSQHTNESIFQTVKKDTFTHVKVPGFSWWKIIHLCKC